MACVPWDGVRSVEKIPGSFFGAIAHALERLHRVLIRHTLDISVSGFAEAVPGCARIAAASGVELPVGRFTDESSDS
jgi:hypothetical protein